MENLVIAEAAKSEPTEPLRFRIVVPIYNEGDILPAILSKIESLGYLDRISFVNDASTDDTESILRSWERTHAIEVLHLSRNRRKEGAIREVLERLCTSDRLPEIVVLLDADSFLDTAGGCVEDAVGVAVSHLERNQLEAVALRIDALLETPATLLHRCVYAEYAAVQFDQWLTSKQWQLWVINGPGGVFRARSLLTVLREMEPDFETGDLLITVKLMQRGYRIGFCADVGVKTTIPSSLAEYFRQRRRWERGTTKVLWNEKSFYFGLFPTRRILALQTILHLSLYWGLLLLSLEAFLSRDPIGTIAWYVLVAAGMWTGANVLKVLCSRQVLVEGRQIQALIWLIGNTLLWTVFTSAARLAGFVDAVTWLWKRRKRRTTGSPQEIEFISGR